MNDRSVSKGRRAFFRRGGVALGAGLASAGVGASSLFDDRQGLQAQLSALQAELGTLQDREALRRLFLAFMALHEQDAQQQAQTLLEEDARVSLDEGERRFLAFRPAGDPALDSCHLSETGDQAEACFHGSVQHGQAISADSSLGAMARQQGFSANRRWQQGHFTVRFARRAQGWKISALQFSQA